jgi:hypothetical protein
MRKFVGLLCAAALVTPAAVIVTASPAAAAPVVTCAKAAGSATFTPPLPKLSSTKLVKAKLAATGTLKSCTGSGGVTAGTIKFTQSGTPEPGNCKTLAEVKSTDKPTIGKLVITWAGGKGTSTVAKFSIKQTKAVIDSVTTGKITAGLFVGKTVKGTTTYTVPAGGCSTKDLAKVTYVNKKGTKFTIG